MSVTSSDSSDSSKVNRANFWFIYFANSGYFPCLYPQPSQCGFWVFDCVEVLEGFVLNLIWREIQAFKSDFLCFSSGVFWYFSETQCLPLLLFAVKAESTPFDIKNAHLGSRNPLNAVVKRQRGIVTSRRSKVRVNESTECNNRERKTLNNTAAEMSEILNTKVLLVWVTKRKGELWFFRLQFWTLHRSICLFTKIF